MPRGATITDTQTTPPKTASASEQAENSSKLERPHPPGLLSDPQANSRPQGLTVFLVVPSPTAVKPTQHLAVCYCPPIARVEYQSRAASARSHPESATAVRWSRGR